MLHVVIPAGGSGTRLWPLSRAGRPKFLLPLGGETTLLQRTVGRLGPLTTPERTYVVTGQRHAAEVSRQLPDLPDANLLAEPSPRDSCAAIGLAAAVIARRSPGAMMGSFAADHLITGVDRFRRVVQDAVTGAERGLLMTVGINPTRPETGYGYLRCGSRLGDGPVRVVEEFTEKPSGEVARAYLESGQHLWNASIFVWRVEVFLTELARRSPDLHEGLVRIAEAWDSSAREEVLARVWPQLPKISVDYAVMEPAAADGMVGTVPGDFGWYDLGDFNTLAEVLPGDEEGNVTPAGTGSVLLRDASGSVVVPGSGRTVAVLGVKDLVIVDTPDALLVCPRDRAQDVKQLVDELKSRGEHGCL